MCSVRIEQALYIRVLQLLFADSVCVSCLSCLVSVQYHLLYVYCICLIRRKLS